MTINDIFKNDFLEQTTGALSLLEMSMTLVAALLIGLGIFFIYRRTFEGVMYSKTFNTSLVILSLISATIIVGVTNNIVLSLGMVGALSIVRFRTSIKDPIDVVYMFWAIGSGIIVGAGLYVLAALAFLMISAVLIAFSKTSTRMSAYLLVMNYGEETDESEIYENVRNATGKYKLKSKTTLPGNTELTIELKMKAEESSLVNELNEVMGVKSVAMLSYDGDYVV
ncbi:DUF4956 domain-containing protein [Gottschalkiaceae bacterium SANA]|jgi:uncharacterized membrane protein YhiD involved in acid resistance|nr:DUF4956 domain-containing protein [Gottschalkiaceae bacterium SANA]